MSGEIQVSAPSGGTIYSLVRNTAGQIWNGSAFENFTVGNYANYPISLTEQSSSGYYVGNFPATAVVGSYNVIALRQIAGSPAQTDVTIATGSIEWNGSAVAPLGLAANSGQIGQIVPIRLARGSMIQNFPFYLVSSIDHVTPLTSGICSGQILRDNGSWGILQSGAFTEKGLGLYNVQALTSGDLLANTVSLIFTGTNVSGLVSDPRVFTMIMQRSSGQ